MQLNLHTHTHILLKIFDVYFSFFKVNIYLKQLNDFVHLKQQDKVT